MSATMDDLPDEVRALIAPREDVAEPAILDTIGREIAAKRDEAKKARSSSGIETLWKRADEAYIGIDDANRHEWAGAAWAKPMSSDGPLTTGKANANNDHRSTVFIRLTARYVDAGAAKTAEILLPADDKAFSFSETPVPDIIKAKEDDREVVHPSGVPLTRPPEPGEAGTPGPTSATSEAAPQAAQQPPPRVPLLVKDLAKENIEMARKSAKAAETRIYDWMVETGYRGEVRKVIHDAARIGVGVLKGPVPFAKKSMALRTEGGKVEVFFKEKIIPKSEWVDPWNIFPDPACGENINDGDYIFERDHMSARQVRGLKRLPGYIASQIDKVLEEGPEKVNGDSSQGPFNNGTVKNKDRFEVWYFYGTLSRDEMDAINAAAGKPPMPDGTKEVYAVVTLINDSVVLATINPLDSGAFPYHSMPWQRRAQHWAGVGVAEQMKAPQSIVNAAVRTLLNNAGKSAGVQLLIDQRAVRPADGEWAVTPDKLWLSTKDAPEDMSRAFASIEIPNATQQLTSIIEMAERFAEETTSIPLVTQGQSGATQPETFGATQIQNNNANQLLRDIGYRFDDHITEPKVRAYYEWLLLDPDVPDEEKAEYQIDAHGSIALVERAIQDQTIGQMGAMAANPAYGINPKNWSREYMRAHKINPDTMMYTEEEQQKMDAAPPADPPVVAAAKVAADTQLKLGAMKQQADQQSVASEERIAQAANVLEGGKVQNDQQALATDSTIRLHQLQMEHERALLKYATDQHVTLEQVKAALAGTAMKLQTQRELNAQDHAVAIHKARQPRPQRGMRPPVQTPGRAPNGQAFEQGAPV